MKKSESYSKLKFVDSNGELKIIIDRLNFHEWRQYSNNQILMVKELMNINVFVDKKISFSIRPPEITNFSQIEIYVQFFFLFSGKFIVCRNVFDSPFLDGILCRVRIVYLRKVILYLEGKLYSSDFSEQCIQLITLFAELLSEYDRVNCQKDSIIMWIAMELNT